GLAQDDREAMRLFKLAADQNNPYGQQNLGVFYRDGRGGLAKDEREAARLFKLAADQGNLNARTALSQLGQQPAVEAQATRTPNQVAPGPGSSTAANSAAHAERRVALVVGN